MDCELYAKSIEKLRVLFAVNSQVRRTRKLKLSHISNGEFHIVGQAEFSTCTCGKRKNPSHSSYSGLNDVRGIGKRREHGIRRIVMLKPKDI